MAAPISPTFRLDEILRAISLSSAISWLRSSSLWNSSALSKAMATMRQSASALATSTGVNSRSRRVSTRSTEPTTLPLATRGRITMLFSPCSCIIELSAPLSRGSRTVEIASGLA